MEKCCTCLLEYVERDMDTVISVLDFEERRQCRHCSSKRIESWVALAAWCDARPKAKDPWKEAEEIGLDASVRFLIAGQVLPCRKATAVFRRTQVVVVKPKVWTEDELAALWDQAWAENLEIDRRYNEELLGEPDDEIERILKETTSIANRSPVGTVVSLRKARNDKARKAFWGDKR